MAEHKSRCDTELLMNGQNRKEKTEAAESLHAEAGHSVAFTSKSTEEMGELKKVILPQPHTAPRSSPLAPT